MIGSIDPTKIDSCKINGSAGYGIRTHKNEVGSWLEGVVATRHGFVSVYSEQGHSGFRFIYQGRHYSATVPKALTDRGLTMLAGKFANYIVEQAEKRSRN